MEYSQFIVGRSQGRTKHGVSVSLLKSAIQKYVRRGETYKAVQCLYEINTLIALENVGEMETEQFREENKQKELSRKTLVQFGKSQRTNIANRILVICSEEVNIHDNPNIPVFIWRSYNKWLNERSDENSMVYLAQAVSVLSNAKKGRLLSHLKSAFNLPPYYVKEKHRARYNIFYESVVLTNFKDLDDRTTCPVYDIEIFITFLKEKNMEKTFRCIGAMCMTKTQSEIKTLFKDIWKRLTALTQNESVAALHCMYKKMTHQERPLYLYHALLLYLYSFTSTAPIIAEPALVVETITSSDTLSDGYIRDHHVSGSKTLLSYIKLMKESFFVPETHLSKKFAMPGYEELYRYIKMGVGHFEEHKEFPNNQQIVQYIELHFGSKQNVPIVETVEVEFCDKLKNMPLAQRRTGKNKKFTHIDFKEQRIIKGPYHCDEPSYTNALKFTRALTLLDENTSSLTAWNWEKTYKCGMNYYLVSKFVSENYEKDEVQRNKKIITNTESWVNGKTYECFERDSKVLGCRIKDLLDENKTNDVLINQAVMQHFYLRYILGVGDTSVSNMLVVEQSTTKQVVAGIDLEEIRKNYDATTLFKLVVGSEVKKQKDLLGKHLREVRVVNWNALNEEFNSLFTLQELADMKHRSIIFNDKLSHEII